MFGQEKTFPLHKAIKYRNIAKIKILLPVTKDINKENEFGYTPLLYACLQESNDKMLEILFECPGIDPLATDDDKQTAVHILAFKGQLSWIKKFYEKFPAAPIDEETLNKNTALIEAAKMDHADVIEYLYKKGANINHQNDKRFTAIHYAANNGYVESTKKLIELGADLNMYDDRDCTPLVKCCSWGFMETCIILLDNGAFIDPRVGRSSKTTPLIQAIHREQLDMVKLLLKRGANPNNGVAGDFITYTPLGTACLKRNIEIFNILIDEGADVNFPGEFSQALFVCVKNKWEEGIRGLIEAKVNLNGRHPLSKQTAADAARKARSFNIVNLLEQKH